MDRTPTTISRLQEKLRHYLATPLKDFYAFGVNRLMLYCLLACFFLLSGLLAWAVYISPHFLIKKMAFTTVYSLHNAVAYAGCHYLIDALANLLWPAWAGYDKRTVGKQWAIWSGGLALGFIMHRTLVRWLVHVYAWDVLDSLSKHPGFPPSHLSFALAVLPVWIACIAGALYVAIRKQQAQQQIHASAIKAILNASSIPEPAGKTAAEPAALDGGAPEGLLGTLTLNTETGDLKIPYERITHITVEDHYSRVFYTGSNGGGLRNVFLRLPLKKLLQALPKDAFVQIHRSHVVNLAHVERLEKTGRECRLVLNPAGVGLPVSRYRLPHLKPRLRDVR